jgi:hypothetical protein
MSKREEDWCGGRAESSAGNSYRFILDSVSSVYIICTRTIHLYKMPKKAKVKYKSLRSNLVHLPLSLYASLTQQQIVSYEARMYGKLILSALNQSSYTLNPLLPLHRGLLLDI